jgi:uncharacterized protein
VTPAGRGTVDPSDRVAPGVLEVAAAAAVYIAMFVAVPPIVRALTDEGTPPRGLTLAALSGVMGLAAFAAAYVLRIRRPAPFGVRSVRGRWLLLAVGLGLLAVILTRVISAVVVLLMGDLSADRQGAYRDAADGGVLPLILQVLFIAVLTPLGEELAFRGVLANALARFGPVVSVVVSTIVFALAHGINLALVPAIIVGATAALLLHATGSIWPGAVVHAVNNGVTTLLPVVLGVGS